jgi:hypothetical protein
MKGISVILDFKDFSYVEEGSSPVLYINMDKAQSLVTADTRIGNNAKVSIRIDYVPKTLPRA